MFYHEKKYFYTKKSVYTEQNYSKVLIVLHNGQMRGRKNYEITCTITEHINHINHGITKQFNDVFELLTYINKNNIKLDVDEIAKYYLSLRSTHRKG